MSLEQHKPVDFKPEFVDKDMFYGMRRAHCIANPHAAMVRAGTMFTGPFHQVRDTYIMHRAVEPCFGPTPCEPLGAAMYGMWRAHSIACPNAAILRTAAMRTGPFHQG